MPSVLKIIIGTSRIETFPFMSVMIQELMKSSILAVQAITGDLFGMWWQVNYFQPFFFKCRSIYSVGAKLNIVHWYTEGT